MLWISLCLLDCCHQCQQPFPDFSVSRLCCALLFPDNWGLHYIAIHLLKLFLIPTVFSFIGKKWKHRRGTDIWVQIVTHICVIWHEFSQSLKKTERGVQPEPIVHMRLFSVFSMHWFSPIKGNPESWFFLMGTHIFTQPAWSNPVSEHRKLMIM